MPRKPATPESLQGFYIPTDKSGGLPPLHPFLVNGTPIRSFLLPSSLKEPYGLAFDGNHIVVGGKGMIMAFDTSGKALWQFQPALSGEKETAWEVFLVLRGRELRLYDGVRTLYRYRMP